MATVAVNGWGLAWLAYPTTVLLLFAAIWLLRLLRNARSEHQVILPHNATLLLALSALFLLMLTHAIITFFLPPHPGISTSLEDVVVGQIACAIVFGVQLVQFLTGSVPSRQVVLGPWILSLIWEVFLGSWAIAIRSTDRPISPGDLANLVLAGLKCLILALLICLITPLPRGLRMLCAVSTESQPLLSGEASVGSIPNSLPTGGTLHYGSTHDNHRRRNTTALNHESQYAANTGTCGSAAPYCSDIVGMPRIMYGVAVFLSYIWPFGVRRLWLRSTGLMLYTLMVACLNVMIPRQIGIAIDASLTPKASVAWISVFILIFLGFAVSAWGVGLLREWLWNPLCSFANETMVCSAYSHVLHLSTDFHDSRSTPRALNAMIASNRLSSLTEMVLFKLIPALLDVPIAVVYLSVTLGSLYGLIAASVGITFFLLSNHFLDKSTTYSKVKKEAMVREVSARQTGLALWYDSDSIGQVGYEDNRHIDLVAARQALDVHYERFWYKSLAVESAVVLFGLGISAFLAVHRGFVKQATPGQVAMLLTYWLQLSLTMISLAKSGKYTSDLLTDAECFIRLMATRPTIKSQGRPLRFKKGDIEFRDVCFEYNDQVPIIRNVSLYITAGQTIALAGPHGAGKSTLMKLLRRCHDATGGAIHIDGQDIRGVDLYGLRSRISVVPQSPVLFDDTVMNNIRYGLNTARDDEVYGACKAACIHEAILTLSQGYDTRVGEYGVGLSSGEVQLIAIARAILKSPDILVLDGTTDALDEQTEKELQASLKNFFQRLTLLIITNRSATIERADHIVVMAKGKILDQGTQEHFHRAGRQYTHMASFWTHDASSERFGNGNGKSACYLADGQKSNTVPDTSQDMSRVITAPEASDFTQDKPSRKEEKSMLNPIAPTFTPRGTRALARAERGTSSSEAASTESQTRLPSSQTSCHWSDEVAAEEERRKFAEEIPVTSAATRLQSLCGERRVEKGAHKEEPEPSIEKHQSDNAEAPDHVSSLSVVQFKYPRYSRRIQSKSEPLYEPAEFDVNLDMVSHGEAFEAENPSPPPQHRRVSAPALKHAQDKSKIAKLAKRNHSATEHTGNTENAPAPAVDCDQPAESVSKKCDQSSNHLLSLTQPQVNDTAKVKVTMKVGEAEREPTLSGGAREGTQPRSQDGRGGHRGRGLRYHGRRRGSRKPSPAISATTGTGAKV